MKKIKITNHFTYPKVLTGIYFMLFTINGFAQARAQADVNITAVTITAAKPLRPTTTGEFSTSRDQPGVKVVPGAETLKCSVTIHS